MKKHLLSLLMLAALICSAMAATAHEGYRSVSVNLSDGSVMTVNLTETLRAYFRNNEMFISDNFKVLVEVPKANIVSFSHSDLASVDDINTDAAVCPVISGNTLSLASLRPGSTVEIFDATTGRELLATAAGVDGSVTIDLASLPKGVAVVTVNHSFNFKIAIQ